MLKIKLLRYACCRYKHYLNTQAPTIYHDDLIRQDKIKEIDKLCDVLLREKNDPPKALTEFKTLFQQSKIVFAKRRDTMSITFIKCILTILTGGLVSLLGLWRVKGNEVNEQLENLASGIVLPDTSESQSPGNGKHQIVPLPDGRGSDILEETMIEAENLKVFNVSAKSRY